MDIQKLLKNQRRFFESGKTLELSFRKTALSRLHRAIKAHEGEICQAMGRDLGKSSMETYMCEVGLSLSELRHVSKHLERWASDRRAVTNLANFPAQSFSVQEPYGVALIMSPWNYPFLLTIEPLIGAIAAGNCCILKPSAYSPSVSAVLALIIEECFPKRYVAVVEGGRAENAALLEQRFDYIFFTGSVSVGKLVMEKASKYLTPVSLELGGKSPCIVDRTADLKLAARRIAFGKYLNCGQTCVAPDYLLIHEEVKREFLRLFAREVRRMYGEEPLKNKDYGRIVNKKHFERIMGLIDWNKVILGGKADPETLRLEPTVLDGVTASDAVMGEEIFGPILPVIGFRDIREAERFVREREKPLALYLFTADRAVERRFLRHVSFGGGCVNDTVIHLATSELGFGGVGNSGMGSYHGRRSFETFSHEKSIVKKSVRLDVPVRYQPYAGWKEFVAHMLLR